MTLEKKSFDEQILPENLAATLTIQVEKDSFRHFFSLPTIFATTALIATASACSLTSNFFIQKSSIL